jgi:hypothetical protein
LPLQSGTLKSAGTSARDRAGEKPYYALIGDTFLFSRRSQSAHHWPGFRAKFRLHRPRRLSDFWFRARSEEHLAGGQEAPPAHWLSCSLTPTPDFPR